MTIDFNLHILIYGLLIFLARVTDVSIGTIRTICIVQGRTLSAFCLAFLEISLWLIVISTVLDRIVAQPILGVFYALGFSTGNVVGIRLEKHMAFGCMILRVISTAHGKTIADKIRKNGYLVTTFQGEGKFGPVMEDYIVCRRRDLKRLLDLVQAVEPDAFYITEPAGAVSKVYRPIMQPVTGWRAALKKK